MVACRDDERLVWMPVLEGERDLDRVVERKDVAQVAEKLGAELYLPPLSLCGDNAAMIGAQGYYEYLTGNIADMNLNAYATKSIIGETL